MSLLPLILGIGGHLDTEGEETSKFKSHPKLKPEQVLDRDNRTCRFCGFHSARYQRVLRHNGEDVTACSFCELVLHLERAALMGNAILIWLPEVTQVQLNHMARAAYIAQESDDENMRGLALRMIEALKSRRTDAKRRIGTDDPMLFYTVLQEGLQSKKRVNIASKIEGIRLFPLDQYLAGSKEVNVFPKMIQFWTSKEGPFAKLPVAEWTKMFEKFKEEKE